MVTLDMSAPERGDGLRSRSFLLLLVGTFLTISGFWALLPVVPLWAQSGGANAGQAGATTGVFMGFTVLTQLAMPWLLRRVQHRLLLAGGAVLHGLATFLYPLGTGLGLLFAASVVRGVGFGVVVVTGTALVAELVPARQRGRGSGWYGLATMLPSVAFLPSGVLSLEIVGYRPLFLLAGAAPLLGALCVLGIARTRPSGPAPAATGGSSLWLRLGLPWLVVLAGAIAGSCAETFLATALRHTGFGVPADLFGFAATMAVCRWLAGSISDRSGRPRLLLPGAVAGMAGIAAVAFAAAAPAGSATWLGLLGCVVLGAGFGALQNDALVLMFSRVDPSRYGTVSTVWNAAFDGGTGIGAFAIGTIADLSGFRSAFLASAALCLLTLPIAVRMLRPARSG